MFDTVNDIWINSKQRKKWRLGITESLLFAPYSDSVCFTKKEIVISKRRCLYFWPVLTAIVNCSLSINIDVNYRDVSTFVCFYTDVFTTVDTLRVCAVEDNNNNKFLILCATTTQVQLVSMPTPLLRWCLDVKNTPLWGV